jgi:four helix bundle protein
MENRKYGQRWQKPGNEGPFLRGGPEKPTPEKGVSPESEKKAFQSFRDLKIWQLGKEIALEAYKLTKAFPDEERPGLTVQMRKTAVSIPCNIGEGHSRRATQDYERFLSLTVGHCAELETQVEIAQELGYLKTVGCENMMEKIDYERRMLLKLLGKLSEKSLPPKERAPIAPTNGPGPLQY